MIQAYIIAEFQSDVDIIGQLLPSELVEHTKLIAAKNQYEAHSLAMSIRLDTKKPLVLIVNTRTEDKDLIEEKFSSTNFLVRPPCPEVPYKIFMAVPEMEIILLQSRNLIERTTKRSFTNLEWEFTFSQPKRLLTRFLGEYPQYIRTIFDNMSVDEMRQLQQHPIIDGITNFLSSASIADSKI